MSIVMNKLICSFKSDLPNEIDFAMQVATLLANTENFSWSKDYPLVDAICSSLHVFSCVCNGNITQACDCYPRFWHKILNNNYAINPYIQIATLPTETEQSYYNFTNIKDHELEDHNRIYKRIKTAAELIKQFSLTCDITLKAEKQQINEEPMDNQNNIFNNHTYHPIKKKPKASPPLLKFVSLLLFCEDTTLNLIGLDILSSIASKLSKVPEQTNDLTCTKLVQMFQEHCIDNISCQDGDIYMIIRSIEVVSRLISSSNTRVYSSVVSLINDRKILLRIEQLLTSRNDVNLFLAALEFFYRISRHQPHLIASRRAQHLVKILVNLLNCEDNQFFTPTALKKIELLDNEELTTITTPTNMLPTKQAPPIATTPTPTTTTTNTTTTTTTKTTTKKTNATTTATNNTQPTKSQPKVQNNCRPSQQPQQQLTPNENCSPITYACEWNNCNLKFSEPKQVFTHVFEVHVGSIQPNELSSCQWTGPKGSGPGCTTKRPKYSLLTHLNDFHCNEAALQRAMSRSDPIKPPEHPGYGPNAALLAIRRHASLEKNGAKSLNHSPLSVSVRLTAALILRNLASQSPEMKQALANHETLLSEICMTNGRDESKIIAECLSLFTSDS
uniref:ARID domain-containing protein C08B11.3 n=1 Tax=Aceria tosichella TaxID=561515 RepID=A0A6G1SLE5_9ACAR